MLLKAGSTVKGNGYTSLLLRERKQELKLLEQRHEKAQLSDDEYRSCCRALLQAIGEINQVMASNRADPMMEGCET